MIQLPRVTAPHLEDHIVEEVDEKVKQTLRKIILAEFKGFSVWADAEELRM